MLIYAIPPLAILLAWALALGFLTIRTLRRAAIGAKSKAAAIWNIAAALALIGALVGLVMGSMSGRSITEYFGSEILGTLLGGGLGAAIGRGANRSSNPAVIFGVVYSALYWTFALLIAGLWLLVNMLGDCFKNTACIQNREQAPPQAGLVLLVALIVYASVLMLRRIWKQRSIAPL